jgi:hypothetical protein
MQESAVRSRRLWLIVALVVTNSPAQAQWSLTGSLGYSRAIQGSGLNGGATYAIGVARTGAGPHIGFELGKYHLGSDRSEFLRQGLFPGDPPGIHISERRQQGWRITASLDLITAGRFSWIGSLGYYRFTGIYSSEVRDTTGQQILRPRSEYGGSSNGAGVMVGFRVNLLELSPDVGFSVEAAGHGVGLRSEEGYSFFHYFSLGGKVRLRI